jgi:hypothetical protein
LIAVPVLLLNTRDDDNELGVATSLSEPPTSESRPSTSVAQLPGRPTYKPASGETLIVPPAGVTGEQVGKEFRNIYAFAVSKDNQDMLCIGEGPIRSAGTFDQDDIVKLRTCVPIPPTRAGRVIALKYNVPSTSNQGAYVFVSTNNTANILVKRTEGNIVPAGRIGSGPTFSLFSTVLGSSKPAIAFTAKDANNVSLENS